MLRSFVEHQVREIIDLGGFWDFKLLDKKSAPPGAPDKMFVPSAWETTPGLENYRAKAVYRKKLILPANQNYRIVFGGVSHTAHVLDGKNSIGFHHDAFTPWEVVSRVSKSGVLDLIVEVDNSFGEISALHIPNDYYTFGGITRPVELQFLPDLYIKKMKLDASFRSSEGVLDIEITVANLSPTPKSCDLDFYLEEIGEHPILGINIPGDSEKTFKIQIRSKKVTPWSNASPRLYHAIAQLNADDIVIDDLIDRVGFRSLEIRGTDIFLNGRKLHLKGYNRHEDHPHYGCALPLEAMIKDLAIIRDTGANFVRTCHYPNDRRFLDLCDEMGFYVWEESHARNIPFTHPKFDSQIEASTREMILSHSNHPSILIWGCLNECDSATKEGEAVYKKILVLMKKLDPSRPVTFASDKQKRDICFKYCDIVSFNIYTGWYSGKLEDIAPFIDDIFAWLDSKKSKGGAGKPVIMSEFGGGAIPGYRNPNRVHWTEEFQSDLLDALLGVYQYHKRIAGVCIWQFCDVRITKENGWWAHRPRTMNNKGIVDEFRRPKLSYETVKKHFRRKNKTP